MNDGVSNCFLTLIKIETKGMTDWNNMIIMKLMLRCIKRGKRFVEKVESNITRCRLLTGYHKLKTFSKLLMMQHHDDHHDDFEIKGEREMKYSCLSSSKSS